MKAQKWLDELERLSKAATQGPWKHDKWIIKSLEARKIAQTINLDNAAYIVAACNAVPRLVEMLNQEAYLLECPYEDEKCPYVEGKTVSCADCKLQYLYERTEPKE